MGKIRRALGLMSGTSMDGIDIALIETDGEGLVRRLAAGGVPYDAAFRDRLRGALSDAHTIKERHERPGDLAAVEGELTHLHADAVLRFIGDRMLQPSAIDVIGFHGQTVLHRWEPDRVIAPPQIGLPPGLAQSSLVFRPSQTGGMLTVQIGDGALLARRLHIPVVYDFRAADIASGGQGAPLVPVFHRALLRTIKDGPVVVVNIGGVANVTYIDGDAEPIAFDTGPGNAPMDELMMSRSGKPMDEDGKVAASGTADEKLAAAALAHPFFAQKPPKSLDRADFARFDLNALSLPNALATAAQIVTSSIVLSRQHFPREPKRWIVAGGGARNPTLMRLLGEKLAPAKVQTAEEVGWKSSAVEAQAFAFLAVRSMKNLPLSFPKTTGVPKPMTGGVLVKP